jgi:hypothetical protein
MAHNKLTLLNGSRIVLDEIHSALVPEVVDFDESSPLILENDQHEYIGTAEVTDVKTETFALLQNKDLENTSHPGTTSWSNALHTLATQVEGFSQLDKVSVVTFYVHAVSGAGLIIAASAPEVDDVVVEESGPEVIPTEEEQYASLDTVGDIDTDVEGNQ